MRIWSEQAFTSKTIDEFISMLEKSEEMMSYAFDVLTKKGKAKGAQKKIYNKDQTINLLERDIRKQVLVHMAANPKCNISSCLVLISITKDAERLGDYIKNIVELPNLLENVESDKELFHLLFDTHGEDLLRMMRITTEAFKNSDKERATEAISFGHEIASHCEKIVEEVVKSDYSNRESVVIALGARYMKRIALHLANVASSVVNPMPEVDYKACE